MKNVLFYISRYPGYGGIEKVTTVLANHWVSVLKWNVSILSVKAQDKTLLKQLDKRVNVYFLPNSSDISCYENVSCIQSLIEKNNIEWVIYQDSYALHHPLLYTIKTQVKIAVVEHNMPDCSWVQYKFRWKNEKPQRIVDLLKKLLYPYYYLKTTKRVCNYHRELYNLCDKYLLLSKKYIPVFKTSVHLYDYAKLGWINNPVTTNIDLFIPRKKTVVFIGRMDLQKGIFMLLEIWKKIYSYHLDWTLIIVGDGELRYQVEKYITQHKIKNIQLEGFQKCIERYLNNASILCMTSIYEGWPLVLFEAMAHGVVPISFDSFKTVNEIITNKKDGLVIPSFNIRKYAEELSALMKDEVAIKNIAKEAIRKSEKFTVGEISKIWDHVLV